MPPPAASAALGDDLRQQTLHGVDAEHDGANT
jgi:hypothetical protein